MNSLFSVFDPVSSILLFNLNWIAIYLFLVAMPQKFFLLRRKYLNLFKLGIKILKTEFTISIGKVPTPGLAFIFVSLFILIVYSNFLGLFPYIFTSTRHLAMAVRIALPLWLGYIIYSTLNNINFFLSHLVPRGTPYVLMPFIVIIELIRRVIRPLTLSVRLAANIVAGHLLIVLVRSPLVSAPWAIIILIFGGLILLVILELAVSVIQSYVFSTLRSLYVIEVNSPNF